MGLDTPSAGSVRVNGQDYRSFRDPLRQVGALLEAKAVHSGRSAFNHLLSLAATHGIPKSPVHTVIELTGLESVAKKRVGGFSLGMGQRLGIAAALLGDPKTLILDEPVNGLDPDGVVWVRQLARHLASEGRTVFLSSHLMSEMAQTADRVVVLGRGKVSRRRPDRRVRRRQRPGVGQRGRWCARPHPTSSSPRSGRRRPRSPRARTAPSWSSAPMPSRSAPRRGADRRGAPRTHPDGCEPRGGVHGPHEGRGRVPGGGHPMSAATTTAMPGRVGLGAGRLVRSEWIKFRSIRSTFWCYAIIVALTIGARGDHRPQRTGHRSARGCRGDPGGREPPDRHAQHLVRRVHRPGGGRARVLSSRASTAPVRSVDLHRRPAPHRCGPGQGGRPGRGHLRGQCGRDRIGVALVALFQADKGVHADLADPSVFMPILGSSVFVTLIALLAFGIGLLVRSSPAASRSPSACSSCSRSCCSSSPAW